MRILYYHQHFSTPAGATGTRSYAFARRLLHHGHRVTMVCGSYGLGRSGLTSTFVGGRREGIFDGIDIIEFQLPYSNQDSFLKRSWTFFRFALRSMNAALFQEYDIVFATSTPLTAGIPGIIARCLRGKRFVFEVRDLWPELPRAMGVITNPWILAAMSGLEWLSYRSAHACIGLSPGIVEGIRRRGIDGRRIQMIPNGSDLALFDIASPIRVTGCDIGDCIAVFTGTHGLANGLAAVLDAAAVLKARLRHDIKLVLIGDGKLKADLVRRASRENLTNCIFLDPKPKAELANILRGADIGMQVLANVPEFYYGTSPNKFFDYIAFGLPILINYPGWLTDRVEQARCGIAVPPDDRKLFADALEYLADHRDELRVMGTNARQLAESNFNRQHLADRFVSLLETIAGR